LNQSSFREKSTKTRIETDRLEKNGKRPIEVLEKNPPKQGLKPHSCFSRQIPSITVLEKNPPKQGLKLAFASAILLDASVLEKNPPKQGLKHRRYINDSIQWSRF